MTNKDELKSEVVEENDFTERVLMSLVVDVTCLANDVEQIKVKVYALAKARGIKPPVE